MSANVKKVTFIKELKNKLGQRAYGSTTEETVLLKAFKYIDLDNSGAVTKDEFLRTMSKIGISGLSQEEISEIFPLLDLDQNGELDYREFISMLYSNKSLTGKKNQEKQKQEEIKQQPQSQPQQQSMSKKEYLAQDSVDSILVTIRNKLASRGVEGICSVARNFRIIDDNNSQTIDFEEFKKCCKDFQFGLNENQIQMAFLAFDRDNTGAIDYDEFLRTIRGEMNDFRKNLVQQAFNILDINGNGEITFDEMISKYNAKQHPEVKSGKKSEEEIINEFMNTFQDTYNYLCGTESDNKITIEEFMEYYENFSMPIDDDAYFELLINNAWRMNDNTTYNNEQKGWSNKNEQPEEGNTRNDLKGNYQERFGDRRPGQTEEEAQKEKEELPLKKFKKEVIKRGGGALISLAKQFKLFDENGNKQLEEEEFNKALREYKVNLSDNEIHQIFNVFDKDGSGLIDYDEFVREVRGPMNEKRTAIVKQAFDKLDIDKSGNIDMYEIKTMYNAKNNKDVKTGKKTEEEVYMDFMETFQAHHYLKAGPRSKRVSLEEFIEYYNYISMNIPDDDYFIFMIQNAWRLSTQAYSKPLGLNNKEEETKVTGPASRQVDLRNRNRDFYTSNVPYGIDEEPKKEEPKVDESLPIIEKFRSIISRRGTRGILSARREFMIADDDNSKNLSIMEFKKFCNDYRIPLKKEEIETLYKDLDKDKSGKIDYDEFLRGVVGEMNERRKKIVVQVFNILDRNNSGIIDLDDIRETYNPKNHPDVRAGKKTEDEVLAEFLDTFEYQFSLLNDGKTKDGKITIEEFIEYYNNISMSIDNDDYFEEVLRSAYNMDNRRPNKKAWRADFSK